MRVTSNAARVSAPYGLDEIRMSRTDARKLPRKDMTLPATLKVEGDSPAIEHPVKVRNLSAAGVMAEGDAPVEPGSLVSVELQDIGWVEGLVAWKQDNRFGIAFASDVDHQLARAQ